VQETVVVRGKGGRGGGVPRGTASCYLHMLFNPWQVG
jgi:hypothetical protein